MSSLVRLTHIPIVRWWRLPNTICLSTNDCYYWCGYKRSAPHCGNPFLTAAAAKGFSGLFTCCQPFPSYELAICRKNIIMTLWPKKVIKPNSTWQAIWNGINHNYYVDNIVYWVEAFLCFLSDSHVSTLRCQHRGERSVPTLCFPCFSFNCSHIHPPHSDDFSSSLFQSTSFFKSWDPHFTVWCMHLNFKQDFLVCLWPLEHCSTPHSTGDPIPPPTRNKYFL